MKKFAVASIDFFDNDLRIKIIETEGGWKAALKLENHLKIEDKELFNEYYNKMPNEIEEAKTFAFNSDWMFDVIEIT